MKSRLPFLLTMFFFCCSVSTSAHATAIGDLLRKYSGTAESFDALPYTYKERITQSVALLNGISIAVNPLIAAAKTEEGAKNASYMIAATCLAYQRMAENEFLLGNWQKYLHYGMRAARLSSSLNRGVPSVLALGVQAEQPIDAKAEDYAWFFFEGEEPSDPMELVARVTHFLVMNPSSDPLRLSHSLAAYKMRGNILNAITCDDLAIEDELMSQRIRRAIDEKRTLDPFDVKPKILRIALADSRYALISKSTAQGDPGLLWKLTRRDFFTHANKIPPKVMAFLLITVIDALHLKNNHVLWSDSDDTLEIAKLYAELAWVYKMAGHPEFFTRCFAEKHLRIASARSSGVRVRYDFLWPDEFPASR